MRLHTLTLRAFGPFATEQVIAFGPLTASGLFLLEGPTGAGKTTILDAITFALYGALSSESAGTDRLHSDFADAGVEPRVMLELSLRGVRYRIARVPEHQRRKKRGDGVTTEPSRVHLERQEDGKWISLSSNKAEVGALVAEIVGLTREQFTQVALLPQGEFARFLRSGDDDRRELLTRLFGTQLYDRVTAELDQRRADAERRRREAQVRITTSMSAALEAAGLDGADSETALSLPAAERAARLAELAARLAAQAQDGRAGLDQAVTAGAAALAASNMAGQQGESGRLRARVGRALAAHEADRPAHAERERQLSAARRAGPIRPLLELLDRAEETTGRARAAVAGLAGPEAGAGSWPVPEEQLRQGQGGAELEARAAATERLAAALRPLAEDERRLPEVRAALRAAEQEAAVTAEADLVLRKSAADLPAAIEGLERRLEAARATAATLDGVRAKAAELAAKRAAAGRLAILGPEVGQRKAAAAAAVTEHQRLVDRHQELVQARLDGMAGELAGQLADGQPCAVCGATAHPAPAARAAGAISAGDVELARQQREVALTSRERIAAELADLVRDEAAQAALAGGRTETDLAAEAAGLAESVRLATEAAEEADRLRQELDGARKDADQLTADRLDSAKRAVSAAGQAAGAGADLAKLAAAVTEAAGEYPSVGLRQQALELAAGRDRELAGALGELARASADEANTRQHAAGQVSAGGFTGLDAARAAALPGAELAALEQAVTRWSTEAAVLWQAAVASGLEWPGSSSTADPGAGLAEAVAQAETAAAAAAELVVAAAAELVGAQAAELAARQLAESAAERARRFGQRQADVEAARAASDALVAATAAEIRLANLARGMDGHRRVALTTYVLRHWFGQVVAAANGRLSAMSSGRYELRRTDEGQTRRQRTGLTLTVIDRHTGEERSPGSLSGGETFYTSLSLALGLADVVKVEAGGVDLDTLFIDEGFGSLDTETLDQVMAVVDDLRNGGRVVGIVSHVADLKDRIPERVEVRRTKDGASAITVVA